MTINSNTKNVRSYLFLVLSCLFFIFIIFLSNAQANSDSSTSLYETARQEYYKLTKSKAKRSNRIEWIKCIDKFKEVIDEFPKTYEGYKATFTVARLYHMLAKELGNSGDIDSALRYYWSLLSEYQINSLSDDALIHLGETYIEKKNYASAQQAFKNVLTNFPDGDQIVQAKKYLKKVKPLAEKQALAEKNKIESANLIEKLEHTSSADSTRIIVYTQGKVNFSQNSLHNPERVYFNFPNTKLVENITRNIKFEKTLLNQIRLSQFDADTSRLVLDLKPESKAFVKAQKDESSIIIDITPAFKEAVTIVKPPAKIPSEKPKQNTVEKKIENKPKIAVKPTKPKKSIKNKTPLIVVDAGHGGKDDGAKGQRGLREKDVNLSISLLLKSILEKRYKYQVVLTRKDDTFIPLKGRGEIANQKGADLFVSVHANAAKRKSAKGIETYYLGSASSERALATAKRENGELVKSVPDDQVQKILASLITTTKLNDSARVAGTVQKRLHKAMSSHYSGVNNLGVKEGPFFVLHDTNMASILVEVGFISNKLEESRLKKKSYLNRLADAIAKGIHEHLLARAPTI
ncbi:MAG: N-acetylmuramoyl-L-alanine amidase [Nitrospinales bacterium]